MEEDSRAELSDILRGSVNVEEHKRERERKGGWREGDSGSRCCEDSSIVQDLFLFSPPHLFQVQKNKELTFSTGVGKPGKWQNAMHLSTAVTCVWVFMPVLGWGGCVFLYTPLGATQTVQTFSTQSGRTLGDMFLSCPLYIPTTFIRLYRFLCSKPLFLISIGLYWFTLRPSSCWEAVMRPVLQLGWCWCCRRC